MDPRTRRRNRQAAPGPGAVATPTAQATPVQRRARAGPLPTPVRVATEERASPLGALVADDDDDDEEDGDFQDDQETTSHNEFGADEGEEEEADEEEEEEEEVDEELDEEDEEMADTDEHARGQPQPFDAAARGLKEISNLGKFTVSSHKLGNGIEELRSDDLKLFWQSDGPQPHKLTIYFIKRVGIRDIRFYVDASEDESYTPTRIVFRSGTGENNLIEFATMVLESPVGWQRVPVEGAGGGPDGNTLYSYVLQMQVLENHQNGKDTHLRGIRIYATAHEAAAGREREDVVADDGDKDEEGGEQPVGQKELDDLLASLDREMGAIDWTAREGGSGIPDFLREPDLR